MKVIIDKDGKKMKHGINEMKGNGSKVVFKGFYMDNFFIVESISEYGQNMYEVLEYEEVNLVPMDEEFTELISFIKEKEGYELTGLKAL